MTDPSNDTQTTSRRQNHLRALAGTWRGLESIEDSRWGPGGMATATVSATESFGGRVLVQDYSVFRLGAPWLEAHAVFVHKPESDHYELFWFDNLGFTPSAGAPGHWDGKALVFVRASTRGHTRHVYTQIDADSYESKLESSFDGGVSWSPVCKGTYIRT